MITETRLGTTMVESTNVVQISAAWKGCTQPQSENRPQVQAVCTGDYRASSSADRWYGFPRFIHDCDLRSVPQNPRQAPRPLPYF
jgi:hypothetical protein